LERESYYLRSTAIDIEIEFYLYSLYAPWPGPAQILLHPFVRISNEGLKKVEIEIGTSQTRGGRPDQTTPHHTTPDKPLSLKMWLERDNVCMMGGVLRTGPFGFGLRMIGRLKEWS
jgi:hypothetical protein